MYQIFSVLSSEKRSCYNKICVGTAVQLLPIRNPLEDPLNARTAVKICAHAEAAVTTGLAAVPRAPPEALPKDPPILSGRISATGFH